VSDEHAQASQPVRGRWSRGRLAALGVGVLGALGVAVALAVFQPWLLWVDQRVEQALPGAPTSTGEAAPAGQAPGLAPAAPQFTLLSAGAFVSAEHPTTGRALIMQGVDGSRLLRLEELDTSNGPDLHVWLSDRPSGGDCAGCPASWGSYDDGAWIPLGPLQGNQGNQNYPVPDDAELAGMLSVVIWCDRFDVAFGTAPILPPP